MANIYIQAAVANNKGRIRSNNEDNFYLNGTHMQYDKLDNGALATYICQDEYQMYAVCDGMGGTDAGEEASYCAVHELSQLKKEYGKMADPGYLTAVLREISNKIYEDALRKGQHSGTTIAMIQLMGNRAIVTNVGDSRVYRFRDGELKQLSLDHSKVQRLISMGVLTKEQAKTDPSRHVISQYLGMPEDVPVAPYMVQELELRKKDIFLLCSDGLTDMVEDEQITAILHEKRTPPDAVKALVETALKNGGRDNVTVMVVEISQVSHIQKSVSEEKNKKFPYRPIFTAAQILIGGGLLLTVIDLIYFLFHK